MAVIRENNERIMFSKDSNYEKEKPIKLKEQVHNKTRYAQRYLLMIDDSIFFFTSFFCVAPQQWSLSPFALK